MDFRPAVQMSFAELHVFFIQLDIFTEFLKKKMWLRIISTMDRNCASLFCHSDYTRF